MFVSFLSLFFVLNRQNFVCLALLVGLSFMVCRVDPHGSVFRRVSLASRNGMSLAAFLLYSRIYIKVNTF